MKLRCCLTLCGVLLFCLTSSAQEFGFKLDSYVSIETEDEIEGSYVRLNEDPEGRILVSYMNEQGTVNSGNQEIGSMARFTADGALDTTFQLDPRIVETWAVAFDNLGRILVTAGLESEQQIDGIAAYRVVRLDQSGAIDPAYESPRFDYLPRQMTIQADGKVLVSSSGYSIVNPHRENVMKIHDRLIRLNADGSLDDGFTDVVFSSGGLWANPLVDGAGNIYLGGDFTGFGGETRPVLARFLPDGTLDIGWQPDPDYFASWRWVRGMQLLANGDLLVAGRGTTGDERNVIFATIDTDTGAPLADVLRSDSIQTARAFQVGSDGTLYTVDGGIAAFSTEGTLLWEEKWTPFEMAFDIDLMGNGDLLVPLNGEIRRYKSDGSREFGQFPQVPLWAENFYPEVAFHPETGLAVGGRYNRRIADEPSLMTLFHPNGGLAKKRHYPKSLFVRGVYSWIEDQEIASHPDNVYGMFYDPHGNLTGFVDQSIADSWMAWAQESDTLTVNAAGNWSIQTGNEAAYTDWQFGIPLTDGRLVYQSGLIDEAPFFFDDWVDEALLLDVLSHDNVVDSYRIEGQRTLDMNPEGEAPVFTRRYVRPLVEFRSGLLLAMGQQVLMLNTSNFMEVADFPRMDVQSTEYQPPAHMGTRYYEFQSGPPQRILERDDHPSVIGGTAFRERSVLLYGAFDAIDGVPSPGIVRILEDGSVDTAFSARLGTGPTVPDGSVGRVEAVAVDEVGFIHVAGRFKAFNGDPAPGYVILYRDGTPVPGLVNFDNKLLGVGTWQPLNALPDAQLARIVPLGEIDMIVVGPYGTEEDGFDGVNRVFREMGLTEEFPTSVMVTSDWGLSPTHGWHSFPDLTRWIYSSEHGYQYIVPVGSPNRFWAWDVNLETFLFFDNTLFPYIWYAGEPSGYLYLLDGGSPGNRQFRDYREGAVRGSVISESDL